MTNKRTEIKSAPLESLVTISGGGTPSKRVPEYYVGDIPWVTPKDMKSWFIDDAEDHINEKAIAESSTSRVEPGAVLVCIRSGVLAHTLPIAINRVPVTLNQDMKAIRCMDGLHAPFLARFLKWYSPHLLRTVRGTTAHSLSMDVVKQVQVPLLPLRDQLHIAEILDKADIIRCKRREAAQLSHEVRLAAISFIVGTDSPEYNQWPSFRIGSVADVQGGLAISQKRNSLPRKVPYLRVANSYRDRFDLTEVKEIGITNEEYEKTVLSVGDVLVVEGHGNRDELGRSAVWDGSIEGCVHQNHLIRIRPDRSCLLPVYLSAYLNSPEGRAQLFQFGKTTSGLNTISISNVRDTTVRLPPLNTQEKLQDILAKQQTLVNRQKSAAVAVDQLFDTLVHRAFRGDL